MSKWKPLNTMPLGLAVLAKGKNINGVVIPEVVVRFSILGAECILIPNGLKATVEVTHWMPLPEDSE